MKFLEEYPNAPRGYIICRTPKAYALNEKIIVLPWDQIISLITQG
jgi:hypothetical protein